MAHSSPPGPLDRPDDGHADHGRLSSWEQRVLDRIEDDLTGSDPDLARRMAPRIGPDAALLREALLWLARLVGALVVLIVIATVVPESGWAVLGVVTALVVLPWLLLCATATRRHD
jgi:hypothetical protein